jgi:hypothetical protein
MGLAGVGGDGKALLRFSSISAVLQTSAGYPFVEQLTTRRIASREFTTCPIPRVIARIGIRSSCLAASSTLTTSTTPCLKALHESLHLTHSRPLSPRPDMTPLSRSLRSFNLRASASASRRLLASASALAFASSSCARFLARFSAAAALAAASALRRSANLACSASFSLCCRSDSAIVPLMIWTKSSMPPQSLA